MGPGRLADEALQHDRGVDAVTPAPAVVLHVGDVGLDALVIGLIERHAPQPLSRGHASGQQLLGQLVVVGEQPRIFVTERHHDRAGQGGQIDHGARLEAVLGVPERVAQHEPPLGVGVDHLDGLARHRFDYVARPLRGARGHILRHGTDADGVDARLARGQRS